ncbi:uncharacterized protein (DUF58 family) [Actinoalloteichus hoggarensis]|uniref:DUF58 domain-containing protein n=1 Tax=Actinoalloteichus hoggarensis TaxID=1470176 RepID=A0A221W0X6_9PSEU|nr:DUF58 domain-containing protein [Actinoalloteichus hoggarensis]ASO19437.1 hypothetical protein AHOG_08965 [Actinoalloteichus hoggarensis]MBB5919858.1 uncharacterized protein (DUF58 family) [Actinoalloteichus hoggarensis]
MRRALSGLTTRGRCLLAAGIAAALCALVLNERDLARVALFTIALPLIAAGVASRSSTSVAVERLVVPTRVQAGHSAEVRLRLWGRGRLRGGSLLLEDSVPYAVGERPRFLTPRPRQRRPLLLSYRVRPSTRGFHRVGPLLLKVTDSFGLAEYDRETAGTSTLIVVPTVQPLHGVPGGSGLGAGEDGSIRLRSGQGEDDAIVRPYRQGDDLRKVHWKSTARRDELMVRVEDRPWRGGTTVLLDTRSAAHRGAGPTSSLEWAVSFAASVCAHLHRFGHQVRLCTDDGQVLAGGTGDGGHGDDAVLDALAMVAPSHRRDLRWTSDPGAGQETFAVLGAVTPGAAAELARHRPRGLRSAAVLLDVRAWAGSDQPAAPDPAPAAALLRAAGWSVVVARPDQLMSAIWAELCHADLRRGAAVIAGDHGRNA